MTAAASEMEDDVVERVREELQRAVTAGEKPPGRDALVELTGLSDWRVRKALKVLKKAGEPTAPAPSSGPSRPVSSVPEAASSPPPDADAQPVASVAQEQLETPPERPEFPEAPLESPEERSGGIAGRRVSGPGPHLWPLLFIGAAAAVAVWSGWVGLGAMTGFGKIQPLPGVFDGFWVNTAVVLPVSVEAYAAYALRCWLGDGEFSRRTRRFSMWSAVASLVIGAGAQVAYHLMEAAGVTRAPWPITMLVACVPVVVLGLASALAKMVSSDRRRSSSLEESG